VSAIFNIVLPLFALIGVGFAVGRTRLFSEAALAGLNIFVFYVALPVMVFFALAGSPLRELFDWRLVVDYEAASLLTFAIAFGLARIAFRNPTGERAVAGATSNFSNIGYLGLPLLTFTLGPEAAVPGALILLFDNVIVLSLTTALLEGSLARHGSAAAIARRLAIGFAQNPLMVALAGGAAWGLIALPIPTPMAGFGALLGGAAGPCALFALGATLARHPVTAGAREVGLMVTLKLIAMPAMALVMTTWMLPLEPIWRATAIIAAALPTGANVFVLATQYGIFVQRASSAILASTALSVVTVSTILAFLTGTP